MTRKLILLCGTLIVSIFLFGITLFYFNYHTDDNNLIIDYFTIMPHHVMPSIDVSNRPAVAIAYLSSILSPTEYLIIGYKVRSETDWWVNNGWIWDYTPEIKPQGSLCDFPHHAYLHYLFRIAMASLLVNDIPMHFRNASLVYGMEKIPMGWSKKVNLLVVCHCEHCKKSSQFSAAYTKLLYRLMTLIKKLVKGYFNDIMLFSVINKGVFTWQKQC